MGDSVTWILDVDDFDTATMQHVAGACIICQFVNRGFVSLGGCGVKFLHVSNEKNLVV